MYQFPDQVGSLKRGKTYISKTFLTRERKSRELKVGGHGSKIEQIFDIFILSGESQVTSLILQVAYLVGKSVKIFWLPCKVFIKKCVASKFTATNPLQVGDQLILVRDLSV